MNFYDDFFIDFFCSILKNKSKEVTSGQVWVIRDPNWVILETPVLVQNKINYQNYYGQTIFDLFVTKNDDFRPKIAKFSNRFDII